MTSAASAQFLISEFQPNPAGADPTDVSLELFGTAGANFSGFFGSIESDNTGSAGEVQDSGAISGTFDVNGLLTVSIGDLENPSFTFFISELDPAGLDLDTDADLVADNVAAFTAINVYDAISIIDDSTNTVDYGAALGGIDFAYSGDEPQSIFRDSSGGAWYAVNDPAGTTVFDSTGTAVNGALFDVDPTVTPTTFGSINPAIPEPSSFALLAGCLALTSVMVRRRSIK
jgi:hypothetical protein